jgi:hypothetical protein
MKKIPTIFKRDPNNMSRLLNEPHPDCGWVFAGEGVAHRKYDGTCCKIENDKLFKRREIKPGKSIPEEFTEEQLDLNTGKRVGWMPVDCENKQDKYHVEGFNNTFGADLPDGYNIDGTYELCGPKVQGNPEKLTKHMLISHEQSFIFEYCPTEYEELKQWLVLCSGEGVVWHHPDGRMAKIKRRDFGYKRP